MGSPIVEKRVSISSQFCYCQSMFLSPLLGTPVRYSFPTCKIHAILLTCSSLSALPPPCISVAVVCVSNRVHLTASMGAGVGISWGSTHSCSSSPNQATISLVPQFKLSVDISMGVSAWVAKGTLHGETPVFFQCPTSSSCYFLFFQVLVSLHPCHSCLFGDRHHYTCGPACHIGAEVLFSFADADWQGRGWRGSGFRKDRRHGWRRVQGTTTSELEGGWRPIPMVYE